LFVEHLLTFTLTQTFTFTFTHLSIYNPSNPTLPSICNSFTVPFSSRQAKTGTLTGNSYVPNGLTREQYAALRAKQDKKKDANYQRNVAKAGKFLDYTQFYIDRGTDKSEAWNKDVNKGHRMAKTKYDWSGSKDNKKQELY
jgi:hypothetical protein